MVHMGAHVRASDPDVSDAYSDVHSKLLQHSAATLAARPVPPCPARGGPATLLSSAERAAPTHRYSALRRGSSGRRPSGRPRAAIGNHTSPHRTTFGVGWPAGFLVGCAESWRLSALRCRRRRVETVTWIIRPRNLDQLSGVGTSDPRRRTRQSNGGRFVDEGSKCGGRIDYGYTPAKPRPLIHPSSPALPNGGIPLPAHGWLPTRVC